MTRFTVTIARHVVKCGDQMVAEVETLATAGTAPDEEQRYMLYSNGWFSTSDIKSTYDPASNLSTGLNASSVGQGPAIVANIVGTAAKLALTAAAMGVAPPEACSPDVANAVKALYPDGQPSLKKSVDNATALLAQHTATLASLNAQLAAAKTDKTLQGKVVQAIQQQKSASDSLEQLQTQLATSLKVTTDIQTVTWPNRSSEASTTAPFKINPDLLKKWMASSVDKATFDAASKSLSVYLALYSQPTNNAWEPLQSLKTDGLKIEGVPVRQARSARLLMCITDACPAKLPEGVNLTDKQYAADFPVLQAGPTYWLPAEGGAFRSQSLAVTLNANGNPSEIHTMEKVAVAESMSGTAKSVATLLSELPAALDAAKLAQIKAETDQLNADIAQQSAQATAGMQTQTNTVTAQKNLVEAKKAYDAAVSSVSLQGQQQEKASLSAQSDVLEAQAVLATAQAKSQVVNETSVLAAQTSLLTAQTVQINAAKALVAAQQQ
ncbi:hypothetical protein [Pseudomonas benzenivorans]|uniref:Uncharacterized protein n=1 Tax=Pseudomonas benzenivorans TaxID=556533 RepID=A0ABY5H6T5_9PSED|nr:hypothetical protein [Pseudomonas benzenivorans]UTW08026.1 hypothetical protein KDW96_01440 [Pseudomonas benzenivorans]